MLSDTVKKWLITGVGLAVTTKEKMEEVVQDLIKQGDVSKEEGEELLNSLLEKADVERKEFSTRLSQEVRKLTNSMGFARTEELTQLRTRVLELEARLARLEEERD